jgi:hypothetical protein
VPIALPEDKDEKPFDVLKKLSDRS